MSGKREARCYVIREFGPTKEMMMGILKIGIPTLMFQLLTSLSIAMINREAGNYGDAVIAGMGTVTRKTAPLARGDFARCDVRTKGTALWKPVAFVKADETFSALRT